MIRRFWEDRRGNYMLLTAAAIVPIMGGLALAVDYSEMSRQRQETLNALDAAGIATARHIVEAGNATDEQIKAYAQQFFEANLGSVDPRDTLLTIVLPKNNSGGGTLELSAALKYKPYFFPTFASLIGQEVSGSSKLDFAAESEVRLKNTLEVALVLDNSGSMDYIGSGSGKKRMDLLKEAAKQLVDTIAGQASLMKQVSKPVQFALVPFAASVNVGPGNADKSWMDTDGISPIHHENFDWTTMSSGNKRVEKTNNMYFKKGAGWGLQENQKITRFTIYKDLQRQTGTTWVKTGEEWVCTKSSWGTCTAGYYKEIGYNAPVYGSYASWRGCVEARPAPYNLTDDPATAATPATMFVPMFAPDETDNRDGNNRRAESNWWADGTTNSSNSYRQGYMPKYFTPAGEIAAAVDDQGPNASCTTNAITPLTDVTTTEGLVAVKAAIDAMKSLGATNVPEGLAWGWRVVSGGAPFTEGRADDEKGNDKVVIVLTDGANTYYTPSSLGYNDLAGNKSTYSSLGYAGKMYDGGSASRLFKDTGVSVNYDNADYTKAMNANFAKLCDNAKAKKLIVMTVSLDLSTSDTTEKAQIDALKACASESRFRKEPVDPSKPSGAQKPAKLFWNATGGNLADKFREIADELSNLRIIG